jgi:type II secretory pathway predicted ATPase ExeA
MFLDFYHLREQPFGVAPDPAYLYLSRTHREALASLSYGIKADRGFMALVAEPGMGKTTLLYQLLEELRDSARTVFLFQTQCDSREFFRYLLSELGVDSSQMGLVAMHNKLNEVLFKEMLAGRRFVLVVDEAHNLGESVLETTRLLSNFERPNTKLLQVVLSGQPPLAAKLGQPGLLQLRQRISILSRLKPLSAAETADYIEHRLKVAGYSGGTLFTPPALALIAEQSQGIPRNINNLCFNALSVGHARGQETISAEILQEVAANLDIHPLLGQPESGPRPAVISPSETPVALTYEPTQRHGLGRWISRGAALSSILLLGSLLLFPSVGKLNRAMQSLAVKAVHGAVAHALADSPGSIGSTANNADPQYISPRQILTVMARPQQTLREICLLYMGRSDKELLEEVRALNPSLKDLDQIEAGQLIQLPLPGGALRKVLDTSEMAGVSKSEPRN